MKIKSLRFVLFGCRSSDKIVALVTAIITAVLLITTTSFLVVSSSSSAVHDNHQQEHQRQPSQSQSYYGKQEQYNSNDDSDIDNDDDDDDEFEQLQLVLPNIIMIVMDDLGSHDLGLHGTGIHTPNIDGLVTGGGIDSNSNSNGADDKYGGNNGIYLEDYYVLPYCSPTRSALLSGMYPLHTGVHNVIKPISTAGLPVGIETLPELLKRARMPVGGNSNGSNNSSAYTYQTHAVGKWHIGHSSWKQTPTYRGFDSFYGFYIGGEDYFTHESGGGVDLHYDKSPNCGEGCSEVVGTERGNYSTHVFTREAIKVIQDHNHANHQHQHQHQHYDYDNLSSNTAHTQHQPSSPLFLYLAYQAVHCPNEVPLQYIEPYQNRTDWTNQRKNYAGMLSAADEGIGKVVTALKETSMWNNTLIVFTTDNGGPTTVGCIQGSSNYPKRGGKCSVWEGGTTGDAILSGPALSKLLLVKSKKSHTKSSSSSSSLLQSSNSTLNELQSQQHNDDNNNSNVSAGDERSKPGSSSIDDNDDNDNDNDNDDDDDDDATPSDNNRKDQHKNKHKNVHQYQYRRFRHLFHVVDWFPTIAEWINVIPRDYTKLDGISQVDALSASSASSGSGDNDDDDDDGVPARTELFGGYAQCLSNSYHHQYPHWWGPSLRHLNWKLIQGVSGGPNAQNNYPPGTKQIQLPGYSTNNNGTSNTTTSNSNNKKKDFLLFDLEKDPREENDISDIYPQMLEKMIYKLQLYRQSFVYPQINDDSQCPFTGLVNTTSAGPAWIPWCDDLQETVLAMQ